MKTFAFSLILFALMIGSIAVNHVYINKISDELFVLASDAPAIDAQGCYSAVSLIDDFWQSKLDIAHLSVSHAELNRVSDMITSMKAFAAAGNRSEYENARHQLLSAIQKMRRLESFSPSSIY